MRRVLLLVMSFVVASLLPPGEPALADDPLDPAHNVPLPCELVGTPGMAPRSAKNVAHVANACGFVGTDVEFQSRTDANGRIRDYAFVGTMGAGLRIFDVTDPRQPRFVGAYSDPGWEDDVQLRGDLATIGFDPVLVGINVSACLRQKSLTSSATRGGVDIIRLAYDPVLATLALPGTFTTHLLGCYLTTLGGGAHNSTIHPSGEWLAVDTSSTGIEVVDLRNNAFTFVRKIPSGVVGAAHDVFFSRDGNTLYSAGVSTTKIVDVHDIFTRDPTVIATIANSPTPDGRTIQISHQSETTADGKIFIITDERGGGLTQTACNTSTGGIIGGAHFWALAEVAGAPGSVGASPSAPKKLGTWVYPNPLLALDPLDPILATLPRTERACTIHMFRSGGVGSNVPGPLHPAYDGVSRLPTGQLVTAHYGAGVWWLDLAGPARSNDGIAEDARSTWGNTLGWNVMPGADTWSAKEYKGFIYAGDMGRGLDVYSFTPCDDLGCVIVPTSMPGSAGGGGRTTDEPAELSIIQGVSAGGTASFGFGVEYVAGQARPTGTLTFSDKAIGKKVQATSVDFLIVAGGTATFGGMASVNGSAVVRYLVRVEDLGEPGTADTLRIILSDGYLAGGVLRNGNVEVSGG